MRRRVGAVLALALVLGLPAGCALPTAGEPTTPSVGSGSDAGSDEPERPTELPTDLRECDVDGKDDAVTVASVTGYDYRTPDGFAEVSGYGQLVDAEGAHTDTYLQPSAAQGVEVLALVAYAALANGPVTDACGRLDVDAVLARLAEHNTASGSVVTAPPTVVEVAGVPALVEERDYPDHGMSVRHYWLYSRTDLLNIQCQWTTHRDEILAGCDALVAGLERR